MDDEESHIGGGRTLEGGGETQRIPIIPGAIGEGEGERGPRGGERQRVPEGRGERKIGLNDAREEEEEVTLGFPILDVPTEFGNELNIKNIPHFVLPNFHGMAFEYIDAFLFEFDILCHTYGYIDDAHKLCLFPTTLKNTALKWVMGLGENTIGHWDTMRKIVLKNYQVYYGPRDSKEDIFRMAQQGDENLKDYLERFVYNLQKSKHSSLNFDIIRAIFLKDIHDEYIDILNLMVSCDISTLPFEQIVEMCRKYSKGGAKVRKGLRDALSKVTKSTIGNINREKLGNMLEKIKTDLLST
jgi:hypothetical protein